MKGGEPCCTLPPLESLTLTLALLQDVQRIVDVTRAVQAAAAAVRRVRRARGGEQGTTGTLGAEAAHRELAARVTRDGGTARPRGQSVRVVA